MRQRGVVRHAAALLGAGMALVASSNAGGESVDPLGADFQLNTYTVGYQDSPATTARTGGGFVVAWRSAGIDGDGMGIAAALLDPDGRREGDEFVVNAYTPGPQWFPDVESFSNRDFVVSWETFTTDPPDADLRARRVRHDGTPLAEDLQVNTYTTGFQFAATISVDAEDGFLIVWMSDGSPEDDDSAQSIQGRYFGSTGEPQGPQFQVNATTAYEQARPAVGALPDSTFVVAWDSRYFDNQTPILVQRIRSDGTRLGREVMANEDLAKIALDPDIAVDGTQGFVVVWSESVDPDAPGFLPEFSVEARRFRRNGTPVGGQFEVSDPEFRMAFEPSIADNRDGTFTVAWRRLGIFDPFRGGDDTSIEASIITPRGVVTAPFPVNTYTPGNQQRPRVASDGSGRVVIAWESPGSPGDDSSFDSVLARTFTVDVPVFIDGFESGDLSMWIPGATAPDRPSIEKAVR